MFVTYSMLVPRVGGAFIRALRLAVEFHRRGWAPIISNYGPVFDDPKIDLAKGIVQFVPPDCDVPGFNSEVVCQQYEKLNPSLVVMGEGPIEAMQVFDRGAKMLKRPYVVLDQYYNDWLMPNKDGVDLVLQYGLKSFWKGDARLPRPYVMVPPFIDSVTPIEELPVPSHLRGYPWLALITYEMSVLKTGIDLLATLGNVEAAIINVSTDPASADRLMDEAGINPERRWSLPLQLDSVVFGLMGASRVTLISNGFLQIMEALAMGSPVIALQRSHGVGMTVFNIDKRFVPFVSFGESQEQQRERILRWLKKSPFPASLLEDLKSERDGTRVCADLIEDLVRRRAAGERDESEQDESEPHENKRHEKAGLLHRARRLLSGFSAGRAK